MLMRNPAYRRGEPPSPRAAALEKASEERILSLRRWSDKLFSVRTTRGAAFRFEPGQFARLGISAGDRGGIVWRPYSMVSAVYDEHLEFLSIVVPGGAFTTRLARAAAGDPLYVEKRPYGYLTTSRFPGGADLWLLASGTGVAPFLSILRDPDTWRRFDNLVLAYSVREARDLAYRETIEALAADPLLAEGGARFHFVPVVTREAVEGALDRRLTELLRDGELERHVGLPMDPERARLLICGNPQMLDDLRDVLRERGLRIDRGREPGHFATENYW